MTQIRAQEPELDCSDAVKLLIERMQTHPEDFGYTGKLYRAINTEQMSTRDLRAYNDAHDRYIKEPSLMVDVLQALLAQPEKEERLTFKTTERYESVASQIYDRAFGSEWVERDN